MKKWRPFPPSFFFSPPLPPPPPPPPPQDTPNPLPADLQTYTPQTHFKKLYDLSARAAASDPSIKRPEMISTLRWLNSTGHFVAAAKRKQAGSDGVRPRHFLNADDTAGLETWLKSLVNSTAHVADETYDAGIPRNSASMPIWPDMNTEETPLWESVTKARKMLLRRARHVAFKDGNALRASRIYNGLLNLHPFSFAVRSEQSLLDERAHKEYVSSWGEQLDERAAQLREQLESKATKKKKNKNKKKRSATEAAVADFEQGVIDDLRRIDELSQVDLFRRVMHARAAGQQPPAPAGGTKERRRDGLRVRKLSKDPDAPAVFTIENFLSEAEADAMVQVAYEREASFPAPLVCFHGNHIEVIRELARDGSVDLARFLSARWRPFWAHHEEMMAMLDEGRYVDASKFSEEDQRAMLSVEYADDHAVYSLGEESGQGQAAASSETPTLPYDVDTDGYPYLCLDTELSEGFAAALNEPWSKSLSLFFNDSQKADAIISRRLEQVAGLRDLGGLNIQLLRYGKSVGYLNHTDCSVGTPLRQQVPGSGASGDESGGGGGGGGGTNDGGGHDEGGEEEGDMRWETNTQLRVITALIYLTDEDHDGLVGGETVLPRQGISVKPKKGMALLFENVRPDPATGVETCDRRSLHRSNPVRSRATAAAKHGGGGGGGGGTVDKLVVQRWYVDGEVSHVRPAPAPIPGRSPWQPFVSCDEMASPDGEETPGLSCRWYENNPYE